MKIPLKFYAWNDWWIKIGKSTFSLRPLREGTEIHKHSFSARKRNAGKHFLGHCFMRLK